MQAAFVYAGLLKGLGFRVWGLGLRADLASGICERRLIRYIGGRRLIHEGGGQKLHVALCQQQAQCVLDLPHERVNTWS